jgi:hypothetical protein
VITSILAGALGALLVLAVVVLVVRWRIRRSYARATQYVQQNHTPVTRSAARPVGLNRQQRRLLERMARKHASRERRSA